MTLKITSITRNNPAPCDHYTVTINDDGVTRTAQITLSQLNTLLDGFDTFPGGARGALVLAWAIDRRKRGATNGQLINVEIESAI